MFGQPSGRGGGTMASRTGFSTAGAKAAEGGPANLGAKKQRDGSSPGKPGGGRGGSANSNTRGGGSSSKRGGGGSRHNHRSNPDANYRPSSSSSETSASDPVQSHSRLGEVDHPHTDNDYARRIYDQLRKDGIRAPAWPADPGNPKSKAALAQFKEQYKSYRDRARASLIKASLIDDPEETKRLEDAIDFKGICEDMCTDWEKITRITEFDVKQAERDPETGWPELAKFVKKLARSAAGQEAPLPMDIRSVATLRRTIDYLVDDLLLTDADLPPIHGFLWDRTRAIRRDFAFFSAPSVAELLDQVYCLETIARFHVTSLHLLSRANTAPDDYSEHQEVEQLGNALMSLRYAYDDCRAQGHECPNEPEFRAYEIILKANQPNILEVTQRESADFWLSSDEVRTAVSLVEALHGTHTFHGPLTRAPATAGEGNHHAYFRIVERADVSYTMACFAEIHFAQLRRSILEAVKKAYARPRESPRDVTAAVLNQQLRFDTVDEAVACAEKFGLRFEADPARPRSVADRILILDGSSSIAHVRLSHQYSTQLVEAKRRGRTISELIHGAPAHENGPFASGLTTTTAVSPAKVRFASPLERPASPSAAFKAAPAPAPSANPFGAPTTAASTTPFSAQQQQQPAQPGPFGFPSAGQTATSATTAPSPFNNPFAKPMQPFGGVPSQQQATTTPGLQAFQQPPQTQPAQQQAVNNPFAQFAPATTQPAPLAAAPQNNPFSAFTKPSAPAQPASILAPPTQSTTSAPSVLQSSLPAPAPSTSSQPPSFFPTLTQPQATPFASLSAPKTDAPKPTPTPTFAPAAPAAPASFTFPPPPATTLGSTTKPAETPAIQLVPPTPHLPSSTAVPAAPAPFPLGGQLTFPPYSEQTSKIIRGVDVPPAQPQPPATTNNAQQPSLLSRMASLPALPALMPTIATEPEVVVKEAPMSRDAFFTGFTNWFVNADCGIMEEFEKFVATEIVTATFNQYKKEEAERAAREAQEKLNAEADAFRRTKLSQKYLVLWYELARAKALRRIRRSGRDQLRAFNEARIKEAARKKKTEEAKRLAQPDPAVEFPKFMDTPGSFRSSLRQQEDALLATGVFSGMDNEREAARRAVRSGSPNGDWLRDSMGPPPLPAKTPVQNGSVVATDDAASVTSATSATSKTTVSAKARRLIEQFGSEKLRRSLPPLEVGNNFSALDSPRSEKKPRHVNLLSERWRLKTMGINTRPDGSLEMGAPMRSSSASRATNWDHVDVAVQRSRRLRRESDTAANAANGFRYSASLRTSPASSVVSLSSLLDNTHNTPSAAPSVAKRKRSSEGEEEFVAAGDGSAKRRGLGNATTTVTGVSSTTAATVSEAQKVAAEMRRMREEMEEGTSWFREQAQMMQAEMSSRGGSVC